jgi:hypothetical protein
MTRQLTLSTLILTICLTGCGQKNTENKKILKIEKNTIQVNLPNTLESNLTDSSFVNSFFGVTVGILKNWNVLNKIQIEEHLNRKIREIESLDRAMTEGQLRNLETDNPFLLIITPGINAEATPLLMINNVQSGMPGGPTSVEEYLSGSKESIEKSYKDVLNLEFSPIEEKIVGGKKFKSRVVKQTIEQEYESFQRIYCSMIKGVFFNIIVNYSNENEWQELEKQLLKIKFI